MKKPILVFISVALLINLFIYFYPADIFQIERNNAIKDKTLKEIFNQDLFSLVTIKGWFLMLIICIGIPTIIAWRSTLTKYDRKTGVKKGSIYDKLK